MIMNGKGFGRKQSWPNLRYYASICLEGVRKTTKKPKSAKPVAGAEISTWDLPNLNQEC
jgi:hypothetical protein